MHLDFAAILVIAAMVTGSIWVLDVLVLAPRRAKAPAAGRGAGREVRTDEKGKLPWYVDFSKSFFPVILAVLVLRSFIVEPFQIPSGSMMPTLVKGDFILVNKFAFGVRLPVVNTKIIDSGAPQRGDVAVFRYPEDPATAFIKRIVALPGDRVEYRHKQLYINGESVPQSRLPASAEGTVNGYEQRLEQLGEAEHRILVRADRHEMPWDRISYTIPAGHYFVMGDNRDNSRDSRVWGLLPEENLIGKAFLIWLNCDCSLIPPEFHVEWDRIGSAIQ